MISQAEERRIASLLGIDVTVIDHDYVLGCYLAFLCQHPEVHASWAFKGGTSLAKCHFGTYRFSEDLDFTARKTLSSETLLAVVDNTNTQLQEHTGIRTDEVSPRVETVSDDYGKESFEVRIYFRGPWNHGGSAPSLQIHVNRDELLAFPVVERPLYHGYSDRGSLPQGTITAYGLEEILAEKLRAFSGQRKRPIARDIFDIHYLLRHGANAEAVRGVFTAKCQVKGIDMMSMEVRTVLAREEEYRRNWERSVEYLVPSSLRIPFAEAWQVAIAQLSALLGVP
jgi:predicted nucleotidyltransferase component of viral defense system